MKSMKAIVFPGANDLRLEEVARPGAGNGEAVIRVTLTTIRGDRSNDVLQVAIKP